MFITRLGHAALLIETSTTRVLIDPGSFSTLWHGLTDLDAVLVTHQHGDHIDVNNIGALLEANDTARVVIEPAVTGMLGDHEAESATVGDVLEIGDLGVEVVGGQHAVIHESIPRIGNFGYVLAEAGGPRLFHPGDSYATTPEGVDILALPLTAPWAKVGETIDFANAIRPARIIPIHDAIASDAGRPIYIRMCSGQIDDSITLDDVAVGHPYSA